MDSDTLHQIIQNYGPFVLGIGTALAIEWVFLPTAIFGIKSRLGAIRDAIERSNALLAQIAKHTAQHPAPPPAPWQMPRQ